MAAECTYCEERFNSKYGIHVKCQTCQDIKLCLDCFSAGAEIGEHSSNHPYELVDSGSFSIIDESWKAYEELALLEAIELYGIGSWTDIANAVGGERTPEECCERYSRVYVENFFGRSAWNAIDKSLYTVTDHTCLHNQPLSPSLSLPERDKIVDISREQQIRLGYMPKRDDFEREYDNEAELLVSRLAVNANDDTELDQGLKVAHINMYADKLRERFRRKRIVLEYNLVKLFFHMHPEENGDLTLTNNLLSTVQPKDSHPANILIKHNSSVPSTPTHSATNDRTQTVNDVTMSTADNQLATNFKPDPCTRSEDDPSKNATTSQHQSGQTTILNYFRRIEPQSRRNSSDPSDNSVLSSYFSDLNKTIAERDFNTMEKQLRIFCQFSSADEHNRLIRNLAREKELKVKIKELLEKKKNGTSSASTTDSRWRLLGEAEKKLCKSINLKPQQYISFKMALIKDCQQKKKKGAMSKSSADSGIDKNVRRRIVDFLTRNNWIKV